MDKRERERETERERVETTGSINGCAAHFIRDQMLSMLLRVQRGSRVGLLLRLRLPRRRCGFGRRRALRPRISFLHLVIESHLKEPDGIRVEERWVHML